MQDTYVLYDNVIGKINSYITTRLSCFSLHQKRAGTTPCKEDGCGGIYSQALSSCEVQWLMYISKHSFTSVVVFYRFEVSEVDVVERWDRGGKKTGSLVILCMKSPDLKFVRRDLGLPPSLNELHHHITVLST